MSKNKTAALILALTITGIASSMAAPPTKTHSFIQDMRKERMEERQEQIAKQASTKRETTIALNMDEKKSPKAFSFHRRHKLGMWGK